MLRHEIVDAVSKGLFHVHAIETIDQGIEILTGYTPGKRLSPRSFTPGSVHALVDATLRTYTRGQKKSDRN